VRDLAEALSQVADAAERVRAAEAELEDARRQLLCALKLARERGATLRQAGDAAGLSRQRVAQLLGPD